jgi:hypothetical protein
MNPVAPVILPPYVGSSLRGAFGGALKREACQCAEMCDMLCEIPRRCPYGSLFETPIESNMPRRVRASKFAPHPFVISPTAAGGTFLPGDTLEFTLSLFGNSAIRNALTVFDALDRMAKDGIGKDRRKLALSRITDVNSEKVLWTGSGVPALEDLEPINVSWDEEDNLPATSGITIRTVTPLQLVRSGNLVTKIDFPELVYSCADRLELVGASAACEPLPSARAWAKKARDSGVTMTALREIRVAIDRFSRRQNRKHPLHGVDGQWQLAGKLEPFIPLLRSGSLTHVGKGTSFGLGKFEVVIAGNDRTTQS